MTFASHLFVFVFTLVAIYFCICGFYRLFRSHANEVHVCSDFFDSLWAFDSYDLNFLPYFDQDVSFSRLVSRQLSQYIAFWFEYWWLNPFLYVNYRGVFCDFFDYLAVHEVSFQSESSVIKWIKIIMIRARFDMRDLGGRPRWRIAGFAVRVSFVFLLLARYFMMSDVNSK